MNVQLVTVKMENYAEIEKTIKKEKTTELSLKGKNKIKLNHPPPIKLETPIQCDFCSSFYYNNIDFALHSIEHAEDGKYNCHICNEYRHHGQYFIKMHVRMHEGTTKYRCEVCNKPFKNHQCAADHKNFHTGEKPYQCDICGNHFMYLSRLQNHRRCTHYEILKGSLLEKFECTKCNKNYKSPLALRKHNKRQHIDTKVDRSVVCEICGKRLCSKDTLRLHTRMHTGYKPYSCHVCSKRFLKGAYLQDHLRVHTGEKPFECQHCGKGFSQRSSLNLHKRTHTGDRPVKCKVCGAGFISKSGLVKHVCKNL